MKKTICVLVVMMALMVCPAQATLKSISSYIVDYSLLNNGIAVNNELNYPLISYNDNTYMAIRDVAYFENKYVTWDEETKTIDVRTHHEESDGREIAGTMGKAIINKYYSNRINENTVYRVNYAVASYKAPKLWWVSVVFNDDQEAENMFGYSLWENEDVRVMIDAQTFDYSLIEKESDGGYKTIIDFTH